MLSSYLVLHFFQVSLWTNIAILPQTWDQISKTVFPTLSFCFLFKAWNCLETSVKCLWNCKSPIFTAFRFNCQKIFNIKNVLLPYLKCQTFSECDICKISMRRIMNIFNQWPYKSQFCVKWVGALLFKKIGLQSLLHGNMNLDLPFDTPKVTFSHRSRTDRRTTRRLELLWAAKNSICVLLSYQNYPSNNFSFFTLKGTLLI